ncbi:hypothetical protein GGI21_000935 [Coemansia aciculifera]|uniref:Uncharacterized protein n=1 Tax=Coemansia aciculifera TaxID=417176 RepID=A0ACC1M7K8_9FUNG|nr:hypothetical protein IWW38_000960 [Coemansia aciculifera]KAJ2910381.1 hypothetical protein GGI21_000935 [Coemansia aciculifera]
MATLGQLAKIALFSGSMAATGNVIVQSFMLWSEQTTPAVVVDSNSSMVDRKAPAPSYDLVQTLRFFSYGVAFTPISYRWHAFLNARFPMADLVAGSLKQRAPAPSSSKALLSQNTSAVLKRLAVDQTVFAPVATLAFVGGMGAMEGLSRNELAERLRVQYPAVLLAGYMLWPAAQLINFSLVPLAYRIPFSSTVSLVWHTYLSWTNTRTKPNSVLSQQIAQAT